MKIEVLLHDFCEDCDYFRCKQVDPCEEIKLVSVGEITFEPRELRLTDVTCQNIDLCAELSVKLLQLQKRITGSVVEEDGE